MPLTTTIYQLYNYLQNSYLMLGNSKVEERVPTAGFTFSRSDKHNDKTNSHLNNFMQRSEIKTEDIA